MKWIVGCLVSIGILLVFSLRIEDWLSVSRARWLYEHALSSDIRIPWDKLSLEIEAESLFKKTVHLRGKDVCLDFPSDGLEVCAKDVELLVKLDFSHVVQSLREITRLHLGDLSIHAKIKPSESPAATHEKTTVNSLLATLEGRAAPAWLEETTIRSLDIAPIHAKLESAEGTRSGNGHLKCETLAEDRRLTCALNLTASRPTQSRYPIFKVSADLTSREGRIFRPEQAQVKVSGRLQSNREIQAKLTLMREQSHIWEIALTTHGKWDGEKYRIEGKGSVSNKTISFDFHANAGAGIPRVALKSCHFLANPENFRTLKLSCSGSAHLAREIKSVLSFQAEVSLKRNESEKNPIEFTSRIDMQPMSDPIAPAIGWVETKFLGDASNFFKEQRVDCAFKWAGIPFQRLRKELEGFHINIPAPFHVLNGKLKVDLACQPHRKGGEFQFPVNVSGKLSSRNQRLDWTTTGTLRWDPHDADTDPALYLDLDSFIDKGRVVLPRLNVRSLPHLFSSSDFLTEVRAATASLIAYRLKIQTRSEPLFVSSNLAKNLIPISGTVEIKSDRPTMASIQVSNVDLELFRRKAKLEHLNFVLNSSSSAAQVDGKLEVPSLDYTVLVTLSGTTDSPQITLHSEPPLPDNEIVAVLLYGSPADETSLSDADDVRNTQSMLLSRSVSLLSLYVFAYTPIQRIDFNPDQKKVAAAFKASDRITVSLGAAARDSRTSGTLGVRRKIGNSWSVVTELNSAGSKETSSGSAWLEWSKRY